MKTSSELVGLMKGFAPLLSILDISVLQLGHSTGSSDSFSLYCHSPWVKSSIFCVPSIMWCVQVLRPPKEVFAAAMQLWRERCEKCVCLQGDYVEK